MFGLCFLFFKKTFFLSKKPWSPPPPQSFAIPTPVLYPVNPPRSVLCISHSGSLTCRAPPPRPSCPSHFPLRFFTSSTPPRPVLRISHSGSLTRRAPPPSPSGPSHFPLRFFLHISHSGSSFTFPTPVLYRHSGRVTLPQVGSKWVHWLPTLHVTNGKPTRSTLR